MTTSIPLLPESAPFSLEQRAWLNGFFAGMFGRTSSPSAVTTSLPQKLTVTVAYGSQSGNAETFAKKYAKRLGSSGFLAKAFPLDDLDAAKLAASDALLVLTSTWGEGEFPDNAKKFWAALCQGDFNTEISGKSFSVLALGDRNYADTYCQAGRVLDDKLADLGATRLSDRVECDVDFASAAKQWETSVGEALAKLTPGNQAPAGVAAKSEKPSKPAVFDKINPFPAVFKRNELLNAPGSAKDTRHIVFSLEGSGLNYEVGDALGVMPQNCPGVVDQFIKASGLDPMSMVVNHREETIPLRQALLANYEIRNHLGKTMPVGLAPQDFVDDLKPLQPRLYSISSSLLAHPGEVHLTVGVVRYEQEGIAHKGVASSFLADRLPLGNTAGVFIHRATHFRLPADDSRPVIMVGPGTGIAPFRAFLEERAARQASGRNWLFFGDQRRAENYLYRTQLEDWKKSGLLTHLTLAFSRDQKEKIYVQDRMREQAAELWQWLEEGAVFYVCGDASRMAKDVEGALLEIATQHGRDPKEFLAALKAEGRYLRDVY